MESINQRLFKQAYDASTDVNKFLDQYELSKLLAGSYDWEGACVIIRAESGDVASQLVKMYTRWAKRHGYVARVVESVSSRGVGLCSATLELETGVHIMVNGSPHGLSVHEGISASVDVIPLFLESTPKLHIDDAHMERSTAREDDVTGTAVAILHVPTSIVVQSSGERSRFANKMKALNRLKAKLLAMSREPRNSSRLPKSEIRRKYVIRPHGLVNDVKTGLRLPDLNAVLEGNIEPLIRAHIRSRYPEF